MVLNSATPLRKYRGNNKASPFDSAGVMLAVFAFPISFSSISFHF